MQWLADNQYSLVKAGHLFFVVSWMIGHLYLPRLMVYHSESEPGSDKSETFKVMERRLMRGIMTPSMIGTWVFGLWLLWIISAWEDGWFHAKFFLVILMSAQHGFAVRWMKEFERDERKRSARFFRFVNEFPALLLVAIIILVIVKPF